MKHQAETMEVDPPAGPEELENLARAFHSTKRTFEENRELTARVDHYERAAAVLERENENLRRVIKRVNSERDHYFRAFTALSAQLDQIASGLVTAIHLARAQAYGARRPPQDKPVDKLDPLPSFLRSTPVAVDLDRLEISIAG
jgi:hypothetical protein